MKILIVSDAWHPQINGVVRTYEHMIPEFEQMGHTVKVIGPNDFFFNFPCPSYSEIKLAFFPKNKLMRMIDDFAPDTIHLATEGPLGVATQKILTKRGIPFSTSYHTQFPDYVKARIQKIMPPLANWFYKIALNRIQKFHNNAASVLVTTQSMKNQLQNWNVKTPIYLYTRGVDQTIFCVNNDVTLLNEIKKPIALYVGRVAIEKNIDAFLEMDWPGSKVIVGNGPEKSCLEKQYPDAIFAGKKIGKDLATHYQASDLFVFPSKTDTFGMVIIEALSCGLPIAAYPVTGPVDIITEPLLGVLDNNLSSAAQKAMDQNIPDGEKNKKKREKYVKTRYTWQQAAEQFMKACPLHDKVMK